MDGKGRAVDLCSSRPKGMEIRRRVAEQQEDIYENCQRTVGSELIISWAQYPSSGLELVAAFEEFRRLS